jgi:hypothetical protein
MGLETQEILIQTSADFKKFAAKIDFLQTLLPQHSFSQTKFQ